MDLVPAVIVASEIGFWVLVLLGLLARYGLGWRRTGVVLLAMTPVVDLVLLTTVIVNLRAGGTASVFHGLAALYIGVSVAYGHKLIRWADVRVAHRFSQGPAPVNHVGAGYAWECWKDVARTLLAVSIALGVLWLLITLVDDPRRTDDLTGLYTPLGIWLTVDVAWAIGHTFWPRRPASPSTPERANPSRQPQSRPDSGPAGKN